MRHDIPLRDGRKQHWLRLHRDEIMAYADLHGVEAAREEYHIVKDSTWQGLVHPKARQPKSPTQIDRLETQLEIVKQNVRELRKESREKDVAYSRFVDAVSSQISDKLLKPLLSSVIELPPELNYKPDNPLSLANFDPKLAKEAAKNSLYVMECHTNETNKET